MDFLALDYGYKPIPDIAVFLLIATAVGYAARKLVKGKALLGLWGDAAIAVLGVVLAGSLARLLHLNLSRVFQEQIPDWGVSLAIWLDVAIIAFIGALLIRLVLKPLTGGG